MNPCSPPCIGATYHESLSALSAAKLTIEYTKSTDMSIRYQAIIRDGNNYNLRSQWQTPVFNILVPLISARGFESIIGMRSTLVCALSGITTNTVR